MKDARPEPATPDRPDASPRGPLPGLAGFLMLLAALLAASYAVGTLAGPVAPGLHPGYSAPAGTSGGDGGTDMGGMDMEEMSR
ncbi:MULTISPECIES: hypothetical protein [Streptomyces]|uniref:Secreted protein n=1 Tax=Streptomyces rubrolavendulae TaxID=285473 RepID=A0A1D8G1Z5_9ACTN|nr:MULTISPECIES: hypothetical protein [Streptomyces]AOT59435.1 hypothetical protein A4G23_02277 [Streptomyces rubrolavendulae]UQS32049.1 hypothetical protein J5J01_11005 [Streptomyces fradiae]